ncbi:hypothetical protein [Rubellimicrobium roseum]|uniref:AlgX/AlgJ SGNH hydrolase-like domain-containing protein n=1 Tax=Rubellimicrobium roseum TaxID=687525 RepID=A0A5C4N6P0_9RHOB|nr:hypothetical protein [Rubellimicrobium roseum]TNC61185.1 hypothetical protein FHG71_21385 [Rubellimicrobium roseum]
MADTASEEPGAAASQTIAEALTIRGDVLVAPNGWLFLHSGAQDQFAYLQAEETPDPAHVHAFWSNLENRARYCRERRLPYLHVVFPSKPVVMTRALPATLRERVQSLYVRSFLPAAPLHGATWALYPVEELRELDGTDLPFLETDTHLTDLGRALVAQAALARWNLGYAINDYFERESGTYQGDLSSMLGEKDPRPRVVLRDKSLNPKTWDNRKFLPGNDLNIVLMHSPRSATPLRLAVIGDSFFRDCLRFLAPVFRDILYLRGPGFHKATLDRFAPHAVMTGNAERYLAKVPLDVSVPDIRAALGQKPLYEPDEHFASGLAAQLSCLDLSLLSHDIVPPVTSSQEVLALQSRSEEQEAELARIEDRLRTKDEKMRKMRKRKDAQIQALRQQLDQREKRLAEADLLLRQKQASLVGRIVRPLRHALGSLRRM